MAFSEEVPPKGQLLAVKQLIRKGVKEGYIQTDYKLIGHRQVRGKRQNNKYIIIIIIVLKYV